MKIKSQIMLLRLLYIHGEICRRIWIWLNTYNFTIWMAMDFVIFIKLPNHSSSPVIIKNNIESPAFACMEYCFFSWLSEEVEEKNPSTIFVRKNSAKIVYLLRTHKK